MRAILAAALFALAGCQIQEPTVAGTVVSVVAIERADTDADEPWKYYEDPLVPEVAWHTQSAWYSSRSLPSVIIGARIRTAPTS